MTGLSRQTPASFKQGGLSRIQEKNRSLILEAALGEFSRKGFSGATVERIAAEAGMSKSNLLYYFSSKEAIYEATLAHILEVWLAPLKTLDPLGDPADELAAYIRQKIELSAKFPEASRLFANEVMQGAPQILPVLETDLKRLVMEKCRVIEDWIEAGRMRPVDPVHLIFTIWATTQHYADFSVQIRALTGKDLSDPDFQRETEASVTALILNGAGLKWPAESDAGA
ncbi:TetR family transcriptional regulator C-terminal domain-containing protein [Labrenzia sp. 011]|uniref:TetR family transcriptional regulator C-terminal domain-containing protein n=1 Tax=Labrenzia sp. 011 TaxID=2171494 RepID=UPI000D50951A|nr:TetR family transcriptional regulator C-terminal domain-containing protein [Labrenzia sp. 011]PVB62767.1 HTH-type transcriptional regulator RutR [Labrenzia sp. 011]